MTPDAAGWMAGILDFQGHVTRKSSRQRARGSYQVVLYVQTSSTEIIARLCSLTGINTEMHDKKRIRAEWDARGCTEHCPEAHVHHLGSEMPQMGRWSVTGAALAVVLWNLRDMLVTTDEPWDWALASTLAGARMSGPGSGMVMSAIRRLASLGWALPPVMQDVIDQEGKEDERRGDAVRDQGDSA